MWIELIALAGAVFLTIQGARRGALVAAVNALAIVLAYAASILVGPKLGPAVAGALGIASPLGIPIACTGVFVAVSVLMSAVARTVRLAQERKRQDAPPSSGDRMLGGCIGAVQGALLGLALGLLAIWLSAGRELTDVGLPDLGGKTLATATRRVVAGASELILDEDDTGARVAVRVAVEPAAAAEDMNRILRSDSVRDLVYDELFWSYVRNGAVDQAANSGSFLALTRDAAVWAELADLGLVTPDEAADPTARRRVARRMLEGIGPCVQAVSNDSEIEALAQDAQIRLALQRGDIMAVLTDPRVRTATERALAACRADA